MIIFKFLLVILGIYFGFYLFFRVFGKAISRFMLRWLQRKAQEDMDRQSRVYQQKAEGYSPFEDTYYVQDDVKVSVKKGQASKPKKDHTLDPNRIETVDFEEVD